MKGPYDDLLSLPRPVSVRHAPMSLLERAAQFSPFAALSGYEDVIAETARLTQRRIELDEETLAHLNTCLCVLADAAAQRPSLSVTFFVPDSCKQGGAYVTHAGRLKKIDATARTLTFVDGTSVAIDDLYEIQSEWLSGLDDE